MKQGCDPKHFLPTRKYFLHYSRSINVIQKALSSFPKMESF